MKKYKNDLAQEFNSIENDFVEHLAKESWSYIKTLEKKISKIEQDN
jgi:hypothetical protein